MFINEFAHYSFSHFPSPWFNSLPSEVLPSAVLSSFRGKSSLCREENICVFPSYWINVLAGYRVLGCLLSTHILTISDLFSHCLVASILVENFVLRPTFVALEDILSFLSGYFKDLCVRCSIKQCLGVDLFIL